MFISISESGLALNRYAVNIKLVPPIALPRSLRRKAHRKHRKPSNFFLTSEKSGCFADACCLERREMVRAWQCKGEEEGRHERQV
jgi:hypothetical protein